MNYCNNKQGDFVVGVVSAWYAAADWIEQNGHYHTLLTCKVSTSVLLYFLRYHLTKNCYL